MIRRVARLLGALCAVVLLGASGAQAAPLVDDGNAEWRVEQPLPPPPEAEGIEEAEAPVSLGHIGDIEFWAPNRGALITAGNGASVKPGVWFYDGTSWRELSTQCGATDGRIAWAGPEEFWTVSDGRAGGAAVTSGKLPPLEDNTLCHFAPGPGGSIEIVASYASVPFLGSSYQAMHAAACISPSDCWFGGEPLPAPQVGAFMLHWNGAGVEPVPYLPEGHAVRAMAPFEGELVESMQLRTGDRSIKQVQRPPALRTVKATSSPEESPFESVGGLAPLLYSSLESSYSLDYLTLGADGEALWAAAGASVPNFPEGRHAGVTVIRRASGGEWETVLGPKPGEPQEDAEGHEVPPPGQIAFPGEVVDGIAAEPGTASAWIALDSEGDVLDPSHLTRAALARIGSEGAVSDRLELPLPEDAHGPLGAAERIVCPATHDCWAATDTGWLLHLATNEEREHPVALGDPVFARAAAGEPITFRPADEGVPQEPSDELPEDSSGEVGFERTESVIKPPPREPAKIPVPLLTHLRSKVVHGSTLVLSFHLAVKARVGLTAERRKRVVAQAAMRTLQSGNRSISLKLDPKRWPTHLHLSTKALAKLPTQSTGAPTVTSVTTSFVAPARLLSSGSIF